MALVPLHALLLDSLGSCEEVQAVRLWVDKGSQPLAEVECIAWQTVQPQLLGSLD